MLVQITKLVNTKITVEIPKDLSSVISGGEAVDPDETERKQGNFIIKHPDIVHYVFLKGIACIAKRYKEEK